MLQELMFNSCSIYSITNPLDAYGNYVLISSLKQSTVQCRRNLKNVTKKLSNGKIKQLPNTFKIYFYQNIDIIEKDIIFLNNEYYDIKHVYKVFDSNTFNHIELIADKVDISLIDNYWLLEDGDLFCWEDNILAQFE